jgi:tRNA-splicing ligase RtcB
MEQINKRLLSWASILEEGTKDQAIQTSEVPWIHGHIALMPDAHVGKGSTVGSVIPTKDVVMPAAVGVDIGCGMSAVRTQLTKAEIEEAPIPLSGLRKYIEREVPVSVGKYREVISESSQHRITKLEGMARTDHIDIDAISSTWRNQLGSLGSGNHFIELCYDEEDRVWVFLHSGSRGVGNRIAQKHIKIAQKLCKMWHVDLPHPDLAFIPAGVDQFWDYFRELRWAQAFAAQNRAEMVDQVVKCLSEWYGEPMLFNEFVNCHHNYTTQEEHNGQNLWITRKGAINAELGARGLIPGSMGTRSYVVSGLGNKASWNSAPHGAGRNFSRTEARKRFTKEQLAEAMVGIEWRSDNAEAFIDEIPGAYKDIDQIMIDASDLVRVEHTLRQFLNVKGD